MIKLTYLILIVILLIAVGCQKLPNQKLSENLLSALTLKSPAFSNQGIIPSSYTCDGEDISPQLEINGVPKNAKSLVLIVDDPDAPLSDWVHWLVWNIDPNTQEIPSNTVPDGAVEGITDFDRTGWGGPCPPSGTHHYQFKLYALDTALNLAENTRKKNLEKAMEGHILDQTMLIGLYKRQR